MPEPYEQPPALPPAGWYDDPEGPGSGRQRRWDGAMWTAEYREPPTRSRWTPQLVLGGTILVLAAIASASVEADRSDFNTARTIGFAMGAVVGPLLIVLVVRFAYVKLFARDRPVWTHWVVVAAAVLGVLNLGGYVARAAEDDDDEIAAATESAEAACPGAEAFVARAGALSLERPPPGAVQSALQAVPEPLRDYYVVRVVRGPGVRAAALAAPLGGEIAFDDFRDGFGEGVPGGLTEGGELPGGSVLYTGELANGGGVALWETNCFAYSVFTPDDRRREAVSRAIDIAVPQA